jgi:hypothetical protein
MPGSLCLKAYYVSAYPMVGLGDRGLSAVLGREPVRAAADHEGRAGGLRGDCGLELDLFISAARRRSLRRGKMK